MQPLTRCHRGAAPGTGWKSHFLAAALAVLVSAGPHALPSAAAAPPHPLPNCYVLAVGVDRYNTPALNPLHGDVNDATNLCQRVQDQAGRLFGRVQPKLLTDARASGPAIRSAMSAFEHASRRGDWVVLILSGHGGIHDRRWQFAAADGTDISDRVILDWADRLAAAGKKVWIMIDACEVGQLRLDARELLERYQDPHGGGILLMLACVPSEESEALGQFSSFAQALNEALEGFANLRGDGVVTLREVREYTYNRTYELIRQFGPDAEAARPHQDSECVASLSISGDQPLAIARVRTVLRADSNLTAQDPGDPQRGGAYAKVYPIDLQAGVTYTIDLESSNFRPLVRLLDRRGNEIASNDHVGGRNFNARVVITPAASGTFRVVATSDVPRTTGSFVLTAVANVGAAPAVRGNS
jgi:hypothetical protein